MRAATLAFLAALALGCTAAGAGAEVYSVGGGETIRVSSAHYGPEAIEPLVQFIATLPHGHEMSKLRLYVAAPGEVTSICGRGADACYLVEAHRIVAPPEFTDGSTVPETLAHEYGHHIVASRPGGAFGTPRWDLYERVCAGIQSGQLLPYNLSSRGYWKNPEEAFAQSYATLAVPELAEEWWYTDRLEPTPGALARIRLDIERPWPAGYAEKRLRRSCHRGYDPYPNYG